MWVQFSRPDRTQSNNLLTQSNPIQSMRTVYILIHIQSNPYPPDRRQTASFKTVNEKYLISHIIKQQLIITRSVIQVIYGPTTYLEKKP